jgi:hypothetical protein
VVTALAVVLVAVVVVQAQPLRKIVLLLHCCIFVSCLCSTGTLLWRWSRPISRGRWLLLLLLLLLLKQGLKVCSVTVADKTGLAHAGLTAWALWALIITAKLLGGCWKKALPEESQLRLPCKDEAQEEVSDETSTEEQCRDEGGWQPCRSQICAHLGKWRRWRA